MFHIFEISDFKIFNEQLYMPVHILAIWIVMRGKEFCNEAFGVEHYKKVTFSKKER